MFFPVLGRPLTHFEKFNNSISAFLKFAYFPWGGGGGGGLHGVGFKDMCQPFGYLFTILLWQESILFAILLWSGGICSLFCCGKKFLNSFLHFTIFFLFEDFLYKIKLYILGMLFIHMTYCIYIWYIYIYIFIYIIHIYIYIYNTYIFKTVSKFTSAAIKR